DDVAAELAHPDLERDARPGRRLLEDHRQRLALERLGGAAVGAFVGRAQVEHLTKRPGIEVGQVQEMLGGWLAGAHDASARLPHVRSMISTASSTCERSMMSGGRRRTMLSPAGTVSRPFSCSAFTMSVLVPTAFIPSIRPRPRTSASTLGYLDATPCTLRRSTS